MHRKAVHPRLNARGGDSHMKQTGMLVVWLRCKFWVLVSLRVFRAKRQYFMPPRSRLGFREETQNYAKRNRSQIFFLTCFVYRIASVIISLNQRFLQIVENIIIRLISDNKGIVITRCKCYILACHCQPLAVSKYSV